MLWLRLFDAGPQTAFASRHPSVRIVPVIVSSVLSPGVAPLLEPPIRKMRRRFSFLCLSRRLTEPSCVV